MKRAAVLCGAVALAFGALSASPASAQLDHYQCYKAKGTPANFKSTVDVTDQFSTGPDQIKKAFLLCNPADKEGGGIINATDHLTCYKVKGLGTTAISGSVSVTDQFGTTPLDVKAKPFLLCVPGTKTVS